MIFVFGDCTLDLDRRELQRAGVGRALERQAFTVLVYLCQHRDRAVSKKELFEACWPGALVTEAALARSLRLIRLAVGDDGNRQEVIKTLRGYGYRFVAAVTALSPPPASQSACSEAPPPAAWGDALVAAIPLFCPECQTANRVTRQFCAACGHVLWQPCLYCRFGNGPTEHFCGGCGREVAAVPATFDIYTGSPRAYTPAHLATKILASQPGGVGERKVATVLVFGIEGVQALRQVRSAEAVDDLLYRGFAQVVAEVHRVEGFIPQVTPYGGTALFGVPLACEDHVLRALRAALGIQRAFAAFAATMQQSHGVVLTLRLGVHTGPALMSALRPDLRFAYAALGTTAEVATGLQQLCREGAVVVSDAVQQQAAGLFRFTELGTHMIPALDAPVGVYLCDGVGAVRSRLEIALARQYTAFHGRRQELALLQACWARARQGAGQVVCLVGEAGIGKSRLAYECQQRLTAARWLTAQALSYGQAMPYHAVLPLLRTVLGMEDTAPSARQHQVLRTRLATIDPALEAEAPLLAHLLGVPLETEALPALAPEAQRRRLQHACLQVLVQQATDAPLCLLVEDGHWLDPSSQALLDLLVATLARRPILVLCTARPGWRHAWADYTYFHQVAVEPLEAAAIDGVLQDLLRPHKSSPALSAWLHGRTGGNPLFVEELVRTMQAQDLLVRPGDAYEMAEAAGSMLPVSVQGLVQARLDQLPAAEKHLLQVAAVIGPEVSLPVLQALTERPAERLQQGVRHLQAAEWLYETRALPDSAYVFKHALVQSAVYQSLLQSTRRQLHQQIAQVLAAQFPALVERQPALLAQHYTEAGLPAQAIPYWHQAGRAASERSAHVEAMAHLTQGLSLLPTLPDTPERTRQELDLSVALAPSLLITRGYEAAEAAQVYHRIQQLCQQVGDAAQVFPALYGLCLFHLVRGECQTARQVGEQALRLAQQVQEPEFLLLAHTVLGGTLFHGGDLPAARRHLEAGVARYEPTRHQALAVQYGDDPGVFCLSILAIVLALLGYVAQAQARSAAAVALARQVPQPFCRAIALVAAFSVHYLRGEDAPARAGAEELLALGAEQGFPHWQAQGQILCGWAVARQGHLQEGEAALRQGLATWHAMGAGILLPYWLALRAEICWWTGQYDAGRAAVTEALAASAQNQEPWWDAPLYVLKGEFLLAQPSTTAPPRAVEACFQQALAMARRQQAKWLELRAALSLCRLWQRQGKRAEAHAVLAPIYAWFTEGFDTADLQEAKSLLGELG